MISAASHDPNSVDFFSAFPFPSSPMSSVSNLSHAPSPLYVMECDWGETIDEAPPFFNTVPLALYVGSAGKYSMGNEGTSLGLFILTNNTNAQDTTTNEGEMVLFSRGLLTHRALLCLRF